MTFSFDDITRLTSLVVDRKLTEFNISKDITQKQLNYIQDKNIPLSLYYSFLATLREEDQVNFTRFKRKVDMYQ